MRERFRHDIPLTLPLQAIVTNSSGCAQPLVDVAAFEQLAAIGMMAPYAGQAIRLELHPHGQGVRPFFGATLPGAMHALRDSHQGLDMMANFVRNDIGLREVTWRVEALIEIAEEGQIEVDLVIIGAIKRTDRG